MSIKVLTKIKVQWCVFYLGKLLDCDLFKLFI